jgi:F-type H+-transporting ATPase subunit gamma
MASSRNEMRFHIRSVGNISQVTRALEAVSISKARKSTELLKATRPYVERAWKVVLHIARQPEGAAEHPLLAPRPDPKKTLVIVVTSDRGLAGGYNMNVVRKVLQTFKSYPYPVSYIAIGERGADMLLHRDLDVTASFTKLITPADLKEITSIGNLAIEMFVDHLCDEVFLCYTEYISRFSQRVVIRKLLPLEIIYDDKDIETYNQTHPTRATFIYEPNKTQVVDTIVPRFVSLQLYAAVLSAEASEHTVRMTAMHNATGNAKEIMQSLEMDYHKTRQKEITNELLDITSGAEALQEGSGEGW